MKKSQIMIYKPVYLGLSTLDLSKTVMCKFWYDYLKPKYDEKAKLFSMDTDSFIVHVTTHDIYKEIAQDDETKFDTLNYDLSRPLLKRKNKNAIGVMKDELGGKMRKEFVGLRAKTYSYFIYDGSEGTSKKQKKKQKSVITKLTFEDYENCLEATQLKNKINHLEKYNLSVNNLRENHKKSS